MDGSPTAPHRKAEPLLAFSPGRGNRAVPVNDGVPAFGCAQTLVSHPGTTAVHAVHQLTHMKCRIQPGEISCPWSDGVRVQLPRRLLNYSLRLFKTVLSFFSLERLLFEVKLCLLKLILTNINSHLEFFY